MTPSAPAHRPGHGSRVERGAATVLAVALLGLLVLVGCALSVMAAIFAAHRTAQSAADLAALAGAGAIVQPGAALGDPCSVAAQTAGANGAHLTGCVVEGRDVRVTVVVTGPQWRGLSANDLVAESRAGPGTSATPS